MDGHTKYANSVFEQPWWLDIVAPGAWDDIIVYADEKKDRIIARLPYVCEKRKIVMPRYTQTLGIWMDDSLREPSRGNNHLNRQKEVINELLDLLPKKNSVDFVLDSSNQYVIPFRWQGYNIEPTFSYRLCDLTHVDLVECNFSKSVKRDINRGKKELVLDESLENIETFIKLQNMTFQRQNRKNPIENDFTRRVISESLKKGHGKLMIARDKDGKAHAGVFMLYDERVCYHLMSGQDTSFGNDCAMPFLIENEIIFAQKVSKTFDFEGSMVEGIEQVYRRYGGEYIINWNVSKETIVGDIKKTMKPRVKKLIGYKI